MRKQKTFRFNKKEFVVNSQFNILMTTTMERSNFIIEVQNAVSMVNFEITIECLHE